MADLAQYIDHTLLKPETTFEDIKRIATEAKDNHFKSVCINPAMVPLAAKELEGSDVLVCTVIGFPLGATNPETKAFEVKNALANGAKEVDMVINIGALKSGEDALVRADIEAVVQAANKEALVKVIIETALLTDDEKKTACSLAVEAGADFVKTSTGFNGGGATIEDVRLMKEAVGDRAGVKASGGVKDRQTALALIEAGASRLGASSGVKILQGETSSENY
ncbi:deoxyribose-phosphate aldolase [Marinococcus halophilus]|uniref:Deoxyribose-phosphate aldolase n=1 Tax=Marinococcus halophilus TaxID=1371 RepID=A0A510Y5Y8_MARHA|nr:deoxyribose-phosphate aldolase [Marinococcus halophilus]OZT81044.1 deoxyribose-phosphate aldolase [Marinococcus halophilus]GEK58754.1 deoxyribose-phosphate aldolase [Marinococcus halophilus]